MAFRHQPFHGRESFDSLAVLAAHLNKSIAIMDLEATGFLGKHTVGICDIAWLCVSPSGQVDSHADCVHPGMRIPYMATRVHGIDDAMVRGKGSFKVVLPELEKVLGNHVVIGFNSRKYDVPVIEQNFKRYGQDRPAIEQLDVREMWMRISGSTKGKLAETAANYGVEVGEQHRASGDVLTTARVLNAMVEAHGVEALLSVAPKEPKEPKVATKTRKAVVAVKEVPPSIEKWISKKTKDRLQEVIEQHLERHGRVQAADYPLIARMAGSTPAAIGYKVNGLWVEGALSREQVVNETVQPSIQGFLDANEDLAGEFVRLKPLKERAEKALNMTIEYIDLRIALSDRESATPSRVRPVMNEPVFDF